MAVQTLDDSNFTSALQNNDKVIVKYFADWCGSCKLFAPKFKRISEAHPDVAFTEVNAEHNPEARKAAGVSNLPFLAVFKNGQLVDAAATSKEEALNELLVKLN